MKDINNRGIELTGGDVLLFPDHIGTIRRCDQHGKMIESRSVGEDNYDDWADQFNRTTVAIVTTDGSRWTYLGVMLAPGGMDSPNDVLNELFSGWRSTDEPNADNAGFFDWLKGLGWKRIENAAFHILEI